MHNVKHQGHIDGHSKGGHGSFSGYMGEKVALHAKVRKHGLAVPVTDHFDMKGEQKAGFHNSKPPHMALNRGK